MKHNNLIKTTIVVAAIYSILPSITWGAGSSVGAVSTTNNPTSAGAGTTTSTSTTTATSGMTNNNTPNANTSANRGYGGYGGTTNNPNTNTASTGNTGMNSNVTTTWSTQNQYWQNHYTSAPYYNSNMSYSAYAPAYQYGVNAYSQNNGQRYDTLDQAKLRADWQRANPNSTLTWDQAQPAIQDAYTHMYNTNHTTYTGATSSTR